MLRFWFLFVGLLMPVSSAFGGSPTAGWFVQPAVSHLVLAADGAHAAWLDLRHDAVSLRYGAIDNMADGKELARLPGRVGLGLHWVGWHLLIHTASAAGARQLTLIDSRDGSKQAQFALDWPATFSIVGLERSGSSMLISHDARLHWAPDIYRLRPATGRLELVEQNPGRIFSWALDGTGELRLARRWRPAGSGIAYQLLVRQRAGSPWRQIAEHDLTAAAIIPHGFTPDGSSVYVATEGPTGAAELRLLDTLTGRPGPAVVDLPAAGIGALQHDPATGALALVGYEQSLPGVKVIQESWRSSIQLLDRNLPGARYRVLGPVGDGNRLWHVVGATQPGGYFVLDPQRLGLQHRAWSFPGLAGREFVEVVPFQLEAEDGLDLRGYLTIPESDSPPPAVVLVHGGPWARDHWSFNPEVQFLAALGYAVIQVNFRSSRGLGNALLQSGRRQWGRGMQTDLVAAVAAATARGLIDPGRVCIMGSSYGGYAALMGAIEFPRVFRCAVARSAVTDLAQQIESFQQQRNRRAYLEWSVMVGDLAGSRGELRLVSPLQRAADLKRPVLLVHGRLDSVVSFSQARQLAAKLAANHAEIRWLPLDDEGHGLSSRHNREVYYAAVADFLETALDPAASKSD